jgi:hypothetical protein
MTATATQGAPAGAIVATDRQRQFLEAVFSGRYRFLAYGGAIRGGKTFALFLAIFALCRVFPGSRWAIVRKDLPTIRRNTLPAFNKVRAMLGDFCAPVNGSDWTATCRNGSQIVFFPESLQEDPDLDRWKGLEVNGFGLEEANELAYKSFNKAIERAGAWIVPNDGEQPPPLILSTFNPASNWVRHTFYEPHRQGTLEAPFYFLPATIADNPHIGAEYRESLTHMEADEYKRFVEGDWDAIGGRFFANVSAKTHLVPRESLPETLPNWWTYWGGYDWGFRHNAVFGAFAEDPDGQRYLLDSVWSHRLTDDEQAERIVETAEVPRAALRTVYAGSDAFNKRQAHAAAPESVADVFQRHGILLRPAYVERVGGWRVLRQHFATKQPDGTQGTPGLVIVDTPGNRRTLQSLLDCAPDPNKPEDVEKFDADEQGRGGDDGADMTRYALATRVRQSKAPEGPAISAWDPKALEAEREQRKVGWQPARKPVLVDPAFGEF